MSGCSRTRAIPGPLWCARRWSGCGTWSPGSGSRSCCVTAPDRLARKFAYQALLLEEFARAGTRVEFVKGPRGDSPEDQLLVQFQGMFAEYEKAQIMERYRRGKAHRARTGSMNVLSGAPFGYRYVRKSDHAGAAYEIVEHEAALVAELFRRYADEGASIARPGALAAPASTCRLAPASIAGTARWSGACCATLPTPGRRCSARPWWWPNPPGLNRVARLQGRATRAHPRPSTGPARSGPRSRCRPSSVPTPLSGSRRRLADNKRFAARNSKVPSLLQGAGRLRGLRIRLLPHLDPHHQQDDLLLPVSGLGRLPLRGRPGVRQQTGPRRLPRPGRVGPHHRAAGRPTADPRRDRPATRRRPHRRSRCRGNVKASTAALAKTTTVDRPHDRGLSASN